MAIAIRAACASLFVSIASLWCASSSGAAPRGLHWATPAESVLYSFPGAPDAAYPQSTLILDSGGTLYGTAGGGSRSCACGAVFALTQSGSTYAESVVYSFRGLAAHDGAFVNNAVTFGHDGALYGTTRLGGVACAVDMSDGCGTVIRLTKNGGNYREDVLRRFNGRNGAIPYAPLSAGPGGLLFGLTGTTAECGSRGECAKVFALAPLRAFATVAKHIADSSDLTVDAKGAIYGTASTGGEHGQGYVWRLVPEGSQYTYQVVYAFGTASSNDGRYPLGRLLVDPSGTIFGVTNGGGADYYGTIYALVPRHGMYQETTLHSFRGFVDGANPVAGVIEDGDGNLYGTTADGGTSDNCYPKSPDTGCGLVYEMVRGSSGYTKTTLYQFTGAPDGSSPFGALTFDGSGALYGTTMYGGGGGANCPFFSEQPGCGTVFKLSPSMREASGRCSNCVPFPARQVSRRRQPA
jgi:hypothetical protein